MANVQDTLARLQTMLDTKKSTKGETITRWKKKDGKNEVLVLPCPFQGDPFQQWDVHQELLDVPYYTVDALSNFLEPGEENDCPIIELIETSKAEDFKGLMPVWRPIQTKTQYWVPLIDLDEPQKGVQWWQFGKSVLTQFMTWVSNLEEDELPFYDLSEPQKVIITFDKTADPANMYKLQLKPIKTADLKNLIKANAEDWLEKCVPLTQMFTNRHSIEERQKLVDDWLVKVTTKAQDTKNNLEDLAEEE